MSREIKFRFYSNVDKKMYAVSLLEVGDAEHLCVYGTGEVWDEYLQTTRVQRYSDGHVVQFTGLLDKSGKEIYEGDIVDHYATYGTVIFEDGMFTLDKSAKIHFGYRQPLCYIDTTECEVIGNIYDNQELLKGGK